ncbi:MAG: aldo/keto reductase [Ignavibacteriaceae bacterium]
MKYRRLGNTDVKVSEISLGCWTMGGLNWVNGVPNGWADVNEKEIEQAINYAIDSGVNHFDNADVYGNGKAERMLARILGKRTNEFIIATKVGWFPGTAEHAYQPEHIRHQCEQSLINLQRDYIDIYYFHHGNFGGNDKYLDDAIETIYKLKDEGKIRLIGQSAYSHNDFVKLIPKVKPDVIQSFSSAMDDRFIKEGSPTRKLLDDHNISFIAFGPIAQGILVGKYTASNPPLFEAGDHRVRAERFKPENLKRVEPIIEKMKARFGSSNQELSRAALQYLLYYNQVGAVIPGFRNLAQVKSNLSGMDNPLTENEFIFMKTIFSEINSY